MCILNKSKNFINFFSFKHYHFCSLKKALHIALAFFIMVHIKQRSHQIVRLLKIVETQGFLTTHTGDMQAKQRQR